MMKIKSTLLAGIILVISSCSNGQNNNLVKLIDAYHGTGAPDKELPSDVTFVKDFTIQDSLNLFLKQNGHQIINFHEEEVRLYDNYKYVVRSNQDLSSQNPNNLYYKNMVRHNDSLCKIQIKRANMYVDAYEGKDLFDKEFAHISEFYKRYNELIKMDPNKVIGKIYSARLNYYNSKGSLKYYLFDMELSKIVEGDLEDYEVNTVLVDPKKYVFRRL